MAGNQCCIDSVATAGEEGTEKSKHKHQPQYFMVVIQDFGVNIIISSSTASRSIILNNRLVLHSQPLDVVLGFLGDELDSLQDVGYVVDASLLDVQDLRGPVQIHHAVS